MLQKALIVCLGYWMIMVVDSFLSTQVISRPICVAPIIGLLLGDLKTGILMGASLEAIFMGVSSVGGAAPADATLGAVIATAFAILSGSSIEESFALAMPIGTLMNGFNSFTTPIWASFAALWEKLATTDEKKYKTVLLLFQIFVSPAIKIVVLFFSVAYGIAGLEKLLSVCPAWITTGITSSAGMLIGVGLSILLAMIYSKETIAYFFVGYIAAKVLGMSTLQIAIIGGVIAVTIFFMEKKMIELEKMRTVPAEAGADVAEKDEDFF